MGRGCYHFIQSADFSLNPVEGGHAIYWMPTATTNQKEKNWTHCLDLQLKPQFERCEVKQKAVGQRVTCSAHTSRSRVNRTTQEVPRSSATIMKIQGT